MHSCRTSDIWCITFTFEKIEAIRSLNGAIRSGSLDLIRELIGRDSSLLSVETHIGSWLHVACFRGRLEIVKYLVEIGMAVNAKQDDYSRSKPICKAASKGHKEVVDYLLSMGAEVDVDHPIRHPLFAAIQGGNVEVVRLIVETGIDVDTLYTTETMTNMSIIDFAKECGDEVIVDYLSNK